MATAKRRHDTADGDLGEASSEGEEEEEVTDTTETVAAAKRVKIEQEMLGQTGLQIQQHQLNL